MTPIGVLQALCEYDPSCGVKFDTIFLCYSDTHVGFANDTFNSVTVTHFIAYANTMFMTNTAQ